MSQANSIQRNMAELSNLQSVLDSHLVGGKLTSDDSQLTYMFHETYGGLSGVRVCLSKGKINAYKLLIQKLDRFYNEEFSWSSSHKVLTSL